MIKYTVEETTTNTCPPCPTSPHSPPPPRGVENPVAAFVGGSIALVVMYLVLKYILIGIYGR